MGRKQTNETRLKISLANKGRKLNRPKLIKLKLPTWYLIEKELLRREKLKLLNIGKNNPMYGKEGAFKGKIHTQRSKELISKKMIGHTHSQLAKEKISKSQLGKTLSEEHKEKLRLRNKNKNTVKSEKTRLKMRLAKLEYIKRNGGGPTIGKYEKQLLDYLENKDDCHIDRSFNTCGYIADGYCNQTNTIYEIYEPYHLRLINIEKDRIRLKNIYNKLKCNIKIILDSDSCKRFIKII